MSRVLFHPATEGTSTRRLPGHARRSLPLLTAGPPGASAVPSGSVPFALMDETFAQRADLVLQRRVTKDVSSYSDAELDALAFDPDEVTALVGLAPTRVYRWGGPGGSGRRANAWQYSTPVMDTMITDDVVTALLDRIDPCAEGIAAACRAFGLRPGIRVLNDSPDPAARALVYYGPTTIQRLARLDVSIEHGE
jgi:hypothetical protein